MAAMAELQRNPSKTREELVGWNLLKVRAAKDSPPIQEETTFTAL